MLFRSLEDSRKREEDNKRLDKEIKKLELEERVRKLRKEEDERNAAKAKEENRRKPKVSPRPLSGLSLPESRPVARISPSNMSSRSSNSSVTTLVDQFESLMDEKPTDNEIGGPSTSRVQSWVNDAPSVLSSVETATLVPESVDETEGRDVFELMEEGHFAPALELVIASQVQSQKIPQIGRAHV